MKVNLKKQGRSMLRPYKDNTFWQTGMGGESYVPSFQEAR
jgi:hypothetical protein